MKHIYTSEEKQALMQNYQDSIASAREAGDCLAKSAITRILLNELDDLRRLGPAEIDYDYHFATLEALGSAITYILASKGGVK